MLQFCSAVQIVVVRDPIDTDPEAYPDLKPYEDGAMAYITAAWNEQQVQSNEVPSDFTIGDGLLYGGDYVNAPLQPNTQYGYFIRYLIENDVDPTAVRHHSFKLLKCMIPLVLQPHKHYSVFVEAKTGLLTDLS